VRIAHLCVSNFFVDGYSYQENLLPKYHKLDGHDVLVIASTETYLDNKVLGYTKPGRYINEDGIPIIRLKYSKLLPHRIMKKLRVHKGIFRLCEDFRPDVIMFHSLCGWELLTVSRYKRHHPEVRFYADSHEDANNSARGIVSRFFLHGLYYRLILQLSLPYIEKIFYISLETREFIKSMYGVPEEQMEFFPLGGDVYPDEMYYQKRRKARSIMNVSSGDIVIVQAGKMGRKKKILQSMQTLQKNKYNKLKLFLIGSIDDEIKDSFLKLLGQDDRITYLGWQESTEMMDFLCAADVYLQPGSQSAIMQNALCLRCPVILDDVISHAPYIQGNGWLLNQDLTLLDVFDEIEANPEQLKLMSEKSFEIAQEILDYKKLARRLCM
jgi:hypothetical protein